MEQDFLEEMINESTERNPQFLQLMEEARQRRRRAVAALLEYREEIKCNHPGQVLEDSSELLHQAREERTRELEQ